MIPRRFLTLPWLAAALLSALTLLFSVGLLITSGALITRAAARPDLADLMLFFVAVRFWGLGRAALRYAERLISHDLVFRWLKDLRMSFFKAWQGVRLEQRLGFRSGDLLKRATSDLDLLQEAPLRLFLPWLAASFTSLILLALLIPISLAASISFLFAVLILGLGWPALCAQAHKNVGRHKLEIGSRLHYNLSEGLFGSHDLLLNNATETWHKQLLDEDLCLNKVEVREARWNSWQDTLSLSITLLLQAAFVISLTPAVSAGNLSWPLAIGLILATAAALEGFNNLGSSWVRSSLLKGIRKRLELNENSLPLTEDRGLEPFPARGDISCENLHLCLGGQEVLKGISLRLPESGLVFLAGPSGHGKTTLLKSFLGLYSPKAGAIRVGSKDYSDFNLSTLTETIATSLQETGILNMSIRENITLGETKHTEEELLSILESLELSHRLGADSQAWNRKIPQGEKALSGGELRRLGLARALLRNKNRLFLDEPFEHLDGDLAGRVLEILWKESKNKLVLVVTHHIPDLRAEDQVAYIENGKLLSFVRFEEFGKAHPNLREWFENQRDSLYQS